MAVVNNKYSDIMHYPEEGAFPCVKYCDILSQPEERNIGRVLRVEKLLIECINGIQTNEYLIYPIEKVIEKIQMVVFSPDKKELKDIYKNALISFLTVSKDLVQTVRGETIQYYKESFAKKSKSIEDFNGDCSTCEHKVACALEKI